MTFLWPKMLLLLAAVPALVALYVAAVARGRSLARRYPRLVGTIPAGGRLRHVPALLFLVGVVTLLVAAARPMAVTAMPSERETVVLAIDVSVSMLAEDVAPNRLAAAQAAAKKFIAAQPESVRLGLVQFGGYAMTAHPPDVRREAVMQAIDRLQPQYGTAIGEAILVSLETALPGADPRATSLRAAQASAGASAHSAGAEEDKAHAAIILLTDGSNTVGTPPLNAARVAAAHGVRIYTVGVGTESGAMVRGEGWATYVTMDEDTLREVAQITGAEYLRAESASELMRVYETLSSRLVVDRKPIEVSALFTIAGALVMLLGAALSLGWRSRIVA